MKIFACLLLLLAVCASAPSRVEAVRRHSRHTKTSNADSGMDLEMPSALPVAPMFSSERGRGRRKGTSGRRGMQELDVPADSVRNKDGTVRGWASSLDPGLGVLPSTNQVANDLCGNAIEVECGGAVDVTSLFDSTVTGDDLLPEIDWTVYPWGQSVPPLINPVNYSRPTGGVWFKVQGNGQRITATTCFSVAPVADTVVEVYEDPGVSCSSLKVVAFNDDFELTVANNACSLYSSLVSWRSEVDVWYKIHVRSWPGYESFELAPPVVDGVNDEFTFNVTCDDPPTNDYCDSAEMLECPGQGTCLEVDGSNLYAGIDHLPYDGTTGRCSYNFTKGQEIQIYYNSPGVWYEVKGTGGAITASTCGQAWEFSTLIEVYKLKSGESGCGTIQPFDNLECVTWLGSMAIPCGPDQECDCAQSKVAWQSQIGETYKVLVKSILNRITDRNHPADPGPLLSENGGSFKLVVCNSPGEFVCDLE